MKGWCRHTEAHLHRQRSPHSCHYSMLHIHLKSRHDSTYIQERLTLRWGHKVSCYGIHRAKVMLSFLRQLQRFWNWRRPSRSKCLTLIKIVATCKLNFTLVLFTLNKLALPSLFPVYHNISVKQYSIIGTHVHCLYMLWYWYSVLGNDDLPSSVVFHVWQAGLTPDSLAFYMAGRTINCSTMQ